MTAIPQGRISRRTGGGSLAASRGTTEPEGRGAPYAGAIQFPEIMKSRGTTCQILQK